MKAISCSFIFDRYKSVNYFLFSDGFTVVIRLEQTKRHSAVCPKTRNYRLNTSANDISHNLEIVALLFPYYSITQLVD